LPCSLSLLVLLIALLIVLVLPCRVVPAESLLLLALHTALLAAPMWLLLLWVLIGVGCTPGCATAPSKLLLCCTVCAF
jgi:hypothetical protein